MFKAIHIYDVDGVLVDSSHRYRNKADGSIDLEYWFENATAENIAKDSLLPMAEQYKADLDNPEIYTVICTSRAAQKADFEFIKARLGMPNKLIVRPIGNMEADSILKRRELCKLLNLRQFKKMARRFWDDNIRNLDAVRTLNVQCNLVQSKICEAK